MNTTEDQLSSQEETIQSLQSKLSKIKREFKTIHESLIEEKKKRELAEKDKENEIEKRERIERMNREVNSTIFIFLQFYLFIFLKILHFYISYVILMKY